MSIKDCRLISLPKISDSRGDLSFIEGGKHIPFDIRRIYYLYNVPLGSNRGGHAHKNLQQIVLPLYGSLDMLIDDGVNKQKYILNKPWEGLYISKMIWREMVNFTPGTVCLVLASNPYDEDDYYREYGSFLKAALHTSKKHTEG